MQGARLAAAATISGCAAGAGAGRRPDGRPRAAPLCAVWPRQPRGSDAPPAHPSEHSTVGARMHYALCLLTAIRFTSVLTTNKEHYIDVLMNRQRQSLTWLPCHITLRVGTTFRNMRACKCRPIRHSTGALTSVSRCAPSCRGAPSSNFPRCWCACFVAMIYRMMIHHLPRTIPLVSCQPGSWLSCGLRCQVSMLRRLAVTQVVTQEEFAAGDYPLAQVLVPPPRPPPGPLPSSSVAEGAVATLPSPATAPAASNTAASLPSIRAASPEASAAAGAADLGGTTQSLGDGTNRSGPAAAAASLAPAAPQPSVLPPVGADGTAAAGHLMHPT